MRIFLGLMLGLFLTSSPASSAGSRDTSPVRSTEATDPPRRPVAPPPAAGPSQEPVPPVGAGIGVFSRAEQRGDLSIITHITQMLGRPRSNSDPAAQGAGPAFIASLSQVDSDPTEGGTSSSGTGKDAADKSQRRLVHQAKSSAAAAAVDPAISPLFVQYWQRIRPGAPLDPQEILRTLQQQSDIEDVEAQMMLGMAHLRGFLQAPIDYERALRYFQAAADQGHVEMAEITGGLYGGLYTDSGWVQLNYTLATKYLYQAMVGGSPKAYAFLGKLYKHRKEVLEELPPEEQQALATEEGRLLKMRDYFRRAWEGNGDDEAPELFVETYDNASESKVGELLKYLEEAERRGQPYSLGMLGLFWKVGYPGFPPNAQLALEYFEASAEQNEPVGRFYTAIHSYEQAAKLGLSSARGQAQLAKAERYGASIKGKTEDFKRMVSKALTDLAFPYLGRETPETTVMGIRLIRLALSLDKGNTFAWHASGVLLENRGNPFLCLALRCFIRGQNYAKSIELRESLRRSPLLSGVADQIIAEEQRRMESERILLEQPPAEGIQSITLQEVLQALPA